LGPALLILSTDLYFLSLARGQRQKPPKKPSSNGERHELGGDSPGEFTEAAELRLATMAGDTSEGNEREPGTSSDIHAEEDAIERHRTPDQYRANSPHQELRETHLSSQGSSA